MHVEHPERAGLDPYARIHRVFQQHECIERIAITAEGVGDVAVVSRIGSRGEEASVEEHPAGFVIDLVLVAATTGNLDDDVDASVGKWVRHAMHGGTSSTQAPCAVVVARMTIWSSSDERAQ